MNADNIVGATLKSTSIIQAPTPAAASKLDNIVIYVYDSSSNQCGSPRMRRTLSLGCLMDSVTRARAGRHRHISLVSNDFRYGRDESLRTSTSYEDMSSRLSIELQRSGFGETGACCSFNNLECIDCVSPRVSTNSLASGLDNWDSTEGADRPTWDIGRTTTIASPVNFRCYTTGTASSGAIARQQQRLAPRHTLSSNNKSSDFPDAGNSLVSRHTSCPTTVTNRNHRLRAHPALTTTSECNSSSTVPQTESQESNDWSTRPGHDMVLQLDSVESDLFNVTTPTDDNSQGRVSPLLGTDEQDDSASFRAEADIFIRSAAARVELIKGHRGTRNVNNGVSFVSDDIGAKSGYADDAVLEQCDRTLVGVDLTETAVDGAATTSGYKSSGRAARSLARTKCLQWLGSLDEGE